MTAIEDHYDEIVDALDYVIATSDHDVSRFIAAHAAVDDMVAEVKQLTAERDSLKEALDKGAASGDPVGTLRAALYAALDARKAAETQRDETRATMQQAKEVISHGQYFHRVHRCEDDTCPCGGEANGTKCRHCVQDWPCTTRSILEQARATLDGSGT